MKSIRSFAIPLIAVFTTQMAAVAAEHSTSSSKKASEPAPAPAIRFLRPVRGEHFFDFPIFLQLDVSGFKLVPPEDTPVKNPPPNTGHILYSMDDFPEYVSDGTQIMIGKTLGPKYLPVGWHVIKVQLVDVNNQPLNPPVSAVTSVFTGHPALAESDHAEKGTLNAELNSQELYQMHLYLEKLQNELLRLKTGNSGFVPSPSAMEGHQGE